MDKQAVITRLSTLDLSRYPYFEIKELIRELGIVGLIKFTLHPGKSSLRRKP